MSGKKIAIVAIPIAVAVIALAAVFAPSPQQDLTQAQAKNNVTTAPSNNENQVVPAASEQDCTTVSGGINTYVVYGDGLGTNETRKMAAERLVDQYCKRPALVHEISAMVNPGIGLVAYACDSTSGKVGDTALHDSLVEYAQVYCESALFVIIDESENVLDTADDSMDALVQQAEGGEDPDTGTGNATAADIDEGKAKLQEASNLAKSAKSKAYSGQYYEAAKSLNSATKLLEGL